ncbi:MAG: hypothetical protein ABJA20_12760 [Novosphingobium sp.]
MDLNQLAADHLDWFAADGWPQPHASVVTAVGVLITAANIGGFPFTAVDMQ